MKAESLNPTGAESPRPPPGPAVIRTVLGDISPETLGVCYAHEHVIIEAGWVTAQNPDFLLADADKAVDELRAFRAAGGNAMIDAMPCDCGRNPEKLAEVSRQTGVHIVGATGIHLGKYYPPGHWSERLSAETLAELFVGDIMKGIDRNDYSGPFLARTPHKAGVIKVAGGLDRLSEHEIKVFQAAALAHRKTGAPVLTHTEQGTAALEQIEILTSGGVPPASITLSHTDRRPDRVLHREILSTGVYVEYDSAFRWKPQRGNPTLDLIEKLYSDGFGDQIMLGMDAARSGYWRSYGGTPGLDFLLKEFIPQMRAVGMGDLLIERLFRHNPAKAYGMAPAENGGGRWPAHR